MESPLFDELYIFSILPLDSLEINTSYYFLSSRSVSPVSFWKRRMLGKQPLWLPQRILMYTVYSCFCLNKGGILRLSEINYFSKDIFNWMSASLSFVVKGYFHIFKIHQSSFRIFCYKDQAPICQNQRVMWIWAYAFVNNWTYDMF